MLIESLDFSNGSILLFCFSYSYAEVKAISDFLLGNTKHRPIIGIVCGSGLGGLVDGLEEQELFSYESIPGFPVSTGRYNMYMVLYSIPPQYTLFFVRTIV